MKSHAQDDNGVQKFKGTISACVTERVAKKYSHAE